jgi:hypothetical protein
MLRVEVMPSAVMLTVVMVSVVSFLAAALFAGLK